jgi:LPXTG-motif cell wall-anchored protein
MPCKVQILARGSKKTGGMPMMWLIILGAVLLVSLIAVLYAVAHAMDYDPAWDEEEDHDYTGRT